MNSIRDNINDEFIKVIAQQNQMHVLPDSTKVWMESGSSIKYTKAFNKREVWLEGNSFFEVYKHEGSFFQVHINKAFIEVKEPVSKSSKLMLKKMKSRCFMVKLNSM